jgi:hypothetical protein
MNRCSSGRNIRKISLVEVGQRDALARWTRASAANVGEYLMDTTLSVELSGLDAEREFDLDALTAAAILEVSEPAKTEN